MKTEFLLLLPIEPFGLGDVYPAGVSLPSHCTLMHWFEFQDIRDRNKFGNDLEKLEEDLKVIELASKAPALFGPNNDVPVHVLERTDSLHILHNRIFALLAKRNALPQELRWVGAGWNPHVTDTATRSFLPGERYSPREIICVERVDGGDRTVRSGWYLED